MGIAINDFYVNLIDAKQEWNSLGSEYYIRIISNKDN